MKQFYNSKSLLRLSFYSFYYFLQLPLLILVKKMTKKNFRIMLFSLRKATTGSELISVVTQVGTVQNTIYSTPTAPLKEGWTSGEMWVNSSQAQINLLLMQCCHKQILNLQLLFNRW
jgi:hypothetical protein